MSLTVSGHSDFQDFAIITCVLLFQDFEIITYELPFKDLAITDIVRPNPKDKLCIYHNPILRPS